MRKIEQTSRFKRDYKREVKGKHKKTLAESLSFVLDLLTQDSLLPERYYDHAMIGNWSDHRNCHIKPDLILIYRLPDDSTIQLVRIGSHSELGI